VGAPRDRRLVFGLLRRIGSDAAAPPDTRVLYG
jgi:hypothetical protein